MWKRKLYVAALGVALANMSIAQLWNSSNIKSFGTNCVECQTAGSQTAMLPMPDGSRSNLDQLNNVIGKNLFEQVTGFTHGNAMGSMPNIASLAPAIPQMPTEPASIFGTNTNPVPNFLGKTDFTAPKPAQLPYGVQQRVQDYYKPYLPYTNGVYPSYLGNYGSGYQSFYRL